MSRASFTIAFDGSALRDGAMDVRDLAPALLAVGRLFDAANIALNADSARVNVNVKATGEGSFEIDLELVQTLSQQLVGLLTKDEITAAVNLVSLISGAGAAVGGLIWLTKKLLGPVYEVA